MERRAFKRKTVDTIGVEQMISNRTLKKICSKGHIINTSVNGFLIVINRKDLINKELRGGLNLDPLLNESVSLYIPQMELELDGTIAKTEHQGKGVFEIFIKFANDTPTYWRECLMDLLPQPGEI